MVSFLQRLAMPMFNLLSGDPITEWHLADHGRAFGQSKRTVAQDQRRAAKSRARRRAKKHGQA